MTYTSSNEVLLNNFIDKDFYLILFPLEVLQWLVFQNKYVIRNSFITSKGVYNNVVCGALVLLLLGTFLCHKARRILGSCARGAAYPFGCATNIVDALCFPPQVLLMYGTNVYLSNKSVELILKMQNIHKYVNTKRNTKYLKLQTWCWSVVTVILFIVSIYSKIATKRSLRAMTVVLIHYFSAANVLLSITYMCFLTSKLNLFNNSLKRGKFNKMYECYNDIFAAYKLYKMHFEIIIILQVVDTFIHQLLAVQSFIEILAQRFCKRVITRDIETFHESTRLKFIFVFRNLVLHCVVVTKCQQFYIAVEAARAECLRGLGRGDCSLCSRRQLKNMLRSHAARFSRVSAGGALAADARLPLALLHALATYTFVLLQFAYN